MKRFGMVIAAAWLLAAAGKAPPVIAVQIADTGPLGGAAAFSLPLAAPAHSTAAAGALEAAPVPNADLVAPRETAGPARPEVLPALFSQKAIFAGNGYAGASSQEQTADDRRQPAAGLSLSVPVK